jgi:hypothetical protein
MILIQSWMEEKLEKHYIATLLVSRSVDVKIGYLFFVCSRTIGRGTIGRWYV